MDLLSQAPVIATPPLGTHQATKTVSKYQRSKYQLNWYFDRVCWYFDRVCWYFEHAKCARCVEKKEIKLALWDTLRQIIWMLSVHDLQPLWQILQVKKWFEASRFNISKNNSKSTLLSFQDKKSLGNPQQTSFFCTCLTPWTHINKDTKPVGSDLF